MRDAIDSLRAGRPVLVTDDADRENEGDVVLAADRVTSEWVAWTVRNTSGLLCAPMAESLADRLALPAMVSDNQDPKRTAYTVTVDAAEGISTGISAADRATTLRALANPSTVPSDLIRPGHVLPLRSRAGGVLARRGHTEAAVDLCELAGLPPVGVIAELVADDGSMLRMPGIEDLAARCNLPLLTIDQLARYRETHSAKEEVASRRVSESAQTSLPTRYGTCRAVGYWDQAAGAEIVALIFGQVGDGVLVRVHSECLTGEAFASQRCECGPQLDSALKMIADQDGILVYLCGQEGRGIGLLNKLAAYGLQDRGMDTVQANLALGKPADGREYGGAAAVLHELGVRSVRLLTNNPDKIAGLENSGVEVSQRIPLHVGAAAANIFYLETKQRRMGHWGPDHGEIPVGQDDPGPPSWPLLYAVAR